MSGLQQLTIVGNLTRDPEEGVNSNGNTFTRATLAVNEYIGGKDTVTYFGITIWNGSGKAFAAHKLARTGAEIFVQGRENVRAATTTDPENGQTRVRTHEENGRRVVTIYRDIMVDEWRILRGPSRKNGTDEESELALEVFIEGEIGELDAAARPAVVPTDLDDEFPG